MKRYQRDNNLPWKKRENTKDYSFERKGKNFFSSIIYFFLAFKKCAKFHGLTSIYYSFETSDIRRRWWKNASRSGSLLISIQSRLKTWITIDGINGKIDDRWRALNENVKERFALPRVRFESISFSLSLDRDIERINDEEMWCVSTERIDD